MLCFEICYLYCGQHYSLLCGYSFVTVLIESMLQRLLTLFIYKFSCSNSYMPNHTDYHDKVSGRFRLWHKTLILYDFHHTYCGLQDRTSTRNGGMNDPSSQRYFITCYLDLFITNKTPNFLFKELVCLHTQCKHKLKKHAHANYNFQQSCVKFRSRVSLHNKKK